MSNANATDQYILLSAIHVDPALNSRHQKAMKAIASNEPPTDPAEAAKAAAADTTVETGLAGLELSIEAHGQDTSVVVRKNPKAKEMGKAYILVAGYRRFQAITNIAKRAFETGNKTPIPSWPDFDPSKPTIRARVKEMSESDAWLENLRENGAREGLSPPDFAFGLMSLAVAYKKEKGTKRGAPRTIAASLNVGENYVSKLLNIMQTLPNACLVHWRESQTPLAVSKMLQLTDETFCPPEKREEAYRALAANKKWPPTTPVANTGSGGTAGEGARIPDVETYLNKVRKSANMIALLVANDFIALHEGVEAFDDAQLKNFLNITVGLGYKDTDTYGMKARTEFKTVFDRVTEAVGGQRERERQFDPSAPPPGQQPPSATPAALPSSPSIASATNGSPSPS